MERENRPDGLCHHGRGEEGGSYLQCEFLLGCCWAPGILGRCFVFSCAVSRLLSLWWSRSPSANNDRMHFYNHVYFHVSAVLQQLASSNVPGSGSTAETTRPPTRLIVFVKPTKSRNRIPNLMIIYWHVSGTVLQIFWAVSRWKVNRVHGHFYYCIAMSFLGLLRHISMDHKFPETSV